MSFIVHYSSYCYKMGMECEVCLQSHNDLVSIRLIQFLFFVITKSLAQSQCHTMPSILAKPFLAPSKQVFMTMILVSLTLLKLFHIKGFVSWTLIIFIVTFIVPENLFVRSFGSYMNPVEGSCLPKIGKWDSSWCHSCSLTFLNLAKWCVFISS